MPYLLQCRIPPGGRTPEHGNIVREQARVHVLEGDILRRGQVYLLVLDRLQLTLVDNFSQRADA